MRAAAFINPLADTPGTADNGLSVSRGYMRCGTYLDVDLTPRRRQGE